MLVWNTAKNVGVETRRTSTQLPIPIVMSDVVVINILSVAEDTESRSTNLRQSPQPQQQHLHLLALLPHSPLPHYPLDGRQWAVMSILHQLEL